MRRWQEKPQRSGTVATGLMLGGWWNSAWHGLRYLGDFWGQAALVSGILMMAAAVLLVVGLLACFIMDAVGLVRLNLG